MAMSDDSKDKKDDRGDKLKKGKKRGPMLGCLVVLVVMIIIPISVLAGMYFMNRDFMFYSNSVLSNLPGSAGEYFAGKPTRSDELQLARTASEFMLELDDKRAADKLKLLQAQDKIAYDDVLRQMLRINPNRTQAILQIIRQDGTEKSALSAIVAEIESEEIQKTEDRANYIASLPTNVAADEITRISHELNGHKEAAEILSLVDNMIAMNIIYELDNEDKNRILGFMDDPKSNEIKASKASQDRRNQELSQIATMLKNEPGESLAEALSLYSEEDQIIILKKLGPRVAGLALSNMPDQDQVFSKIAKIKSMALLEDGKDEITDDIIKALKVYRDFDDNIKELTAVYSQMELGKVSQVIRDMLLNKNPPKVYKLSNGDNVELDEMLLVTKILKNFPEKTVAEILSKLDNTLTSEISRMLALPTNN